MSRAASTPAAGISDWQQRQLGQQDYETIWDQMREFTQQRNAQTQDEVWYLQHPPVYTLGLNGKRHHVLNQNNIPLIPVDRGGQITYHGPGQLVAYLLLDIDRRKLGIKNVVNLIEQAVINYLAELDIQAERKDGAPGIYVGGAKIAALGLRVKKGCTYHGLSLNVDMDLTPFHDINPCGYEGMPVTQLTDLLESPPKMEQVIGDLHRHLAEQLGYNIA